MHWFYNVVHDFLTSWGYWALLLGLFGESMGLPLPGETVLMFASFLTHKETGLHIYWVILVGIAAAVMGDNLGYLLGHHLGGTFIRWAQKLFRLDDDDIRAARNLIKTHGGKTIFFSRFVFGLRTIAGPMAGRQLGNGMEAVLQIQLSGSCYVGLCHGVCGIFIRQ